MPDVNEPTHEPASLTDLPMQPTGSGPADLEVAYEQMRLVKDAEATTGNPPAEGIVEAAVPTEDTQDAADSAAHPS